MSQTKTALLCYFTRGQARFGDVWACALVDLDYAPGFLEGVILTQIIAELASGPYMRRGGKTSEWMRRALRLEATWITLGTFALTR